MQFFIRQQEYKVFLYRLFLVFVFYQWARLLFYCYNYDLIEVHSISEYLKLASYGLTFDITAILYVNLLFIVLSLLPLFINTTKGFQKILFWLYFITNFIAYATNFIDFIYYKFTYTRTTTAGLESIQHEQNLGKLFWSFLFHYWHVFILFFISTWIWTWLYKRIRVKGFENHNLSQYLISSLIVFVIIGVLVVGGIRGDFKYSTRPINMVDANRHIEKVEQSDLILNTPFALIRTINKNDFKKRQDVSETEIARLLHPIKTYRREASKRPNIIILIVESFGREYIGAFNKNKIIKNYQGYTPFIDSLAAQSLIFPNAFANGRKSIHAMSSVLAGIPSFKVAYTSSPYANQKPQSLVSILNEMNYDTSFFHGAPNGSMGFLGFGNILGFDHYYGKNEYNDEDDFDGIWGIWDNPFLQYVNRILDKKSQPFMTTIFTLSSHDPFAVPKEDIGRYPEGNLPIHKCIGYTDNALKEFFKTASQSDWYDNTIFVITGDHCNQTYYDEYKKLVNRFAVPIIVYQPKSNLVGVDKSLAQQIDIYPTLVDLSGYQKPFRTWGRSLVGDSISKPYAITHNGSIYLIQQDSLIYSMDDQKTIGYYNIQDKGLQQKLKELTTAQKDSIRLRAQSFVQDYMHRIVDRKLSAE